MITVSVCSRGWEKEGQDDTVMQATGGHGGLKSGGVRVVAHGGGLKNIIFRS